MAPCTFPLWTVPRVDVLCCPPLLCCGGGVAHCLLSDLFLSVSVSQLSLSVQVWGLPSGELLQRLQGSGAPVCWLSLLPDGGLVSWSRGEQRVVLWKMDSDPRTRPPEHLPPGCTLLGLAKDCSHAYWVHADHRTQVVCWDPLQGGFSSLCWSGPGPGLVWSSLVWSGLQLTPDLCAGGVSETLAVSAEVVCLVLAHNKRLLFCGLRTGTVLIYPLDRPQETLCLPPPESLPRVQALALDPGERQLAAAYEDSLALFQVTTRDGTPVVEGPVRTLTLDLLQAPVSAAALLADGRLLYGTGGGELRLWASSAPRGPAPRSPTPLEAAPGPTPLEAGHSPVTCVQAGNSGLHALVASGGGASGGGASGSGRLTLWSLSPPTLDHTMEFTSQVS